MHHYIRIMDIDNSTIAINGILPGIMTAAMAHQVVVQSSKHTK
jgi:hypothetical protein